jgi:hypothetical protein
VDGRALVSLISSVILGALFLYAVACGARIYAADRPESSWCSGLLGRLAVGAASVLATVLALTVTAASWSAGGRPFRALLGHLDDGAAGAVQVPQPVAAPAPAPPRPPARRTDAFYVWNGRVIHSAEPQPEHRSQPDRSSRWERPERLSRHGR